jgi:hypothetical protein
MNAVAKILTDAADLIDAKGWTQGVDRSPDGCYCLRGALFTVAEHSSTIDRNAACDAVVRAIGRPWIALWNDAPIRTQAEVTDMLRAVAAKQATA